MSARALQSAGEEWFPYCDEDMPEADMQAVAGGNLSELSLPILVASRDQEQFEEFCFREGLVCSQVLRYRGAQSIRDVRCCKNKILLLLPGWQDDWRTRTEVDFWIHEKNRFTCEMRFPHPVVQSVRAPWIWIAAASLLFWIFVAWLIVR